MLRLFRLTLNFRIRRELRFDGFTGFASRGIFYRLLKTADEGLAKEVHDSKTLAPFSTTPLMSGGRICFNKVPPGYASVSFVLLDEGLNRKLVEVLTEGGGELKLMDEAIPLTSIELRSVGYEELYEGSSGSSSFTVSFVSPTYFRLTPRDASRRYKDKEVRSPYRYLPLPDPVLLFRSLSRLWRRFSGLDVGLREFMDWIEMGGVAVYGYPSGIRTYKVYDGQTKRWCVGFLGEVQYSIPEDLFEPRMAKIAEALLRFGEYSNVGGGRTSGLGMVRYGKAV